MRRIRAEARPCRTAQFGITVQTVNPHADDILKGTIAHYIFLFGLDAKVPILASQHERKIALGMFFLAQNGACYATSRVISYEVDADGVARVTVDGVDGKILVDDNHWSRALAQSAQSLVAASPGTYALWLWRDGEGNVGGYNRTNIISWSIGADGHVHGWTVDGVDHGQGDLPAVLHPDGRVEVCFDQVYDSVAEWFADAKA